MTYNETVPDYEDERKHRSVDFSIDEYAVDCAFCLFKVTPKGVIFVLTDKGCERYVSKI